MSGFLCHIEYYIHSLKMHCDTTRETSHFPKAKSLQNSSRLSSPNHNSIWSAKNLAEIKLKTLVVNFFVAQVQICVGFPFIGKQEKLFEVFKLSLNRNSCASETCRLNCGSNILKVLDESKILETFCKTMQLRYKDLASLIQMLKFFHILIGNSLWKHFQKNGIKRLFLITHVIGIGRGHR